MRKASNVKKEFLIFKKKINQIVDEFYKNVGDEFEIDIINMNKSKVNSSHQNWIDSIKNTVKVSHFTIGLFKPNGGKFDYFHPDFIPEGYIPVDESS